MVAHADKPTNKHIYADAMFTLYRKISSNDMPPYIRRLLNSSYLFGLHKDPTNPLKLRPIVVGSSLRPAFTSCLVKNNTPLFTN